MFKTNKKYLEDYTIKEIYINFPFFEEKFSSIINAQELRVFYKNDFYSKLKFVKALNEYRNSLYLMPYVSKYADGMIDRVLNSVSSVKTLDIDQNLTYNSVSGEVIFDRKSTEALVFEDLMDRFTEIALKDLHTKYKDNFGSIIKCDGLDKARIEYIGNELKNIRRNRKYTNGCIEFRKQGSTNVQIFERLIKLFGDERMLTFNSSNIQEFSKKFSERGVFFDLFVEELNEMNKIESSSDHKEEMKLRLNNDLLFMEKQENEILAYQKKPSKKAIAQAKGFKKLLDSNKNISQELKEQMYNNLLKNLKDIEYKEFSDNRWGGLYYYDELKISLRRILIQSVDSKYKTLLHELVHAATTTKDEIGRTRKVGFGEIEGKIGETCGYGLDEGATEYFAQRLYKSTGRKAVDVAYPQNVEVIERLVGLYGENVILDAMINNTDNLEQLMAIDGAKYEELRGLMDDYHNQVYYNANGLHAGDAVRTVEAQEMYNKIQGFIQDIEDRRKIEDKDIPIQEDGSKISNWFKNFKNKLNNIFSFF